MSANNLILIKELIDGSFVMRNIDVDAGGGFSIGKAKTIKEATKLVENYMKENEVEYGYKIIWQDPTQDN